MQGQVEQVIHERPYRNWPTAALHRTVESGRLRKLPEIVGFHVSRELHLRKIEDAIKAQAR